MTCLPSAYVLGYILRRSAAGDAELGCHSKPRTVLTIGLPGYIGRNYRQDGAEEGFELAANFFSRFHDFLVGECLIENAGRHVGDAGDGENFDAHVAGGDHFGYGRHAYEVGADRSEVADLSGGFVTRT